MIRTPSTSVVGVTLDAEDVRRLDAAAARQLDTRAAFIRKTILERLRTEVISKHGREPIPA